MAKVLSFDTPHDTADPATSLYVDDHSHSNSSTTFHLICEQKYHTKQLFSLDPQIEHSLRNPRCRGTLKQPNWRKSLSLTQYPASNSDQHQIIQKCQKIHSWMDYLGGDHFLGAVSSSPVKPAAQLLSLSLSIKTPKSERSIPWGTFLLGQTWQSQTISHVAKQQHMQKQNLRTEAGIFNSTNYFSWDAGQLTTAWPLKFPVHRMNERNKLLCKTSYCNTTFYFSKYSEAISSTTLLDGCFITLVMGERAGSRGTGWNMEHDPSPTRTQGKDAFQKRDNFATGEVILLVSASCGHNLPSEHNIFYENMHCSILHSASHFTMAEKLTLDNLSFTKNRSTPATQTISVQWKLGKNDTRYFILAVDFLWKKEDEEVFHVMGCITENTSSHDC